MIYDTYIGIDMSKDSFHACFPDASIKQYSVKLKGLTAFLKALEGFQKDKILVGVETTGTYHLPLAVYCKEHGIDIGIVNPYVTSQLAKGLSIHTVKTDKKDARVVREAIMLGRYELFKAEVSNIALKSLVQQHISLVQLRSELKCKLHALSYTEKAFAVTMSATYLKAVQAMDTCIKDVDAQMRIYERDTQKLLQTIVGIGETGSAALVAYVIDIKRFTSPEALVSYVGLEVVVRDSGTSVHKPGYISKRGNRHLRGILYNCAAVAVLHDKELKAFYLKKKQEGKHHTKILCAVERKLLHRVFAVWTRGTAYVKS